MDKHDLSSGTSLTLFARISKIHKTRRGDNLLFDAIAPNNVMKITCRMMYQLPIMEDDAIYAYGIIDDEGKLEITKKPFLSPGNDEASIESACRFALGYENKDYRPIISEIRKILNPDEELPTRLDNIATAYNKYGTAGIRFVVVDTLQPSLKKLLVWWFHKRCMRRLYLLGLTKQEISKSGKDPNTLFSICLDNPYPILSLSLDKCDTIMAMIGKKPSQDVRQCGVIIRDLNDLLNNKKQTYISKDEMKKICPKIRNYIKQLTLDYGILETPTYYAIDKIHTIETDVADFIKSLLFKKKLTIPQDIDDHLDTCDEDQKEAIKGVLIEPITIITGPAGTGKTTLLRSLTAILDQYDKKYVLTSFTGKAVARIKDIVPHSEPMTLHRLISNKTNQKEEGASSELVFDYLIIDEASMVETELFSRFIKVYPKGYRVVLIGDINQLSPIGWGCFFDQVIRSQVVPTYYLTKNHRSEGAGIVENAKGVVDGYFFKGSDDFKLCYGRKALDLIKELNLDPTETRVLAPYNETVLTNNNILQEYFANGQVPREDKKGRRWYLQDRVMMTKNNYTVKIMNGQEGFITSFNKDGFEVAFGGVAIPFAYQYDGLEELLKLWPPKQGYYLDLDLREEVTPSMAKKKKFSDQSLKIASNNNVRITNMKGELEKNKREKIEGEDDREIPLVDHLIHSYALTVHKSQGSEWDYVIIDLPAKAGKSSFVTRNLLYTALTRAKKKIFLLGNEESWMRCLINCEQEPKQLLAKLIES